MYTHNTVNRDFHVEQFTTKNGKLRLTIRDSKGRLAELTRPQNLDAKSNTFEVVNFITKIGVLQLLQVGKDLLLHFQPILQTISLQEMGKV